MTSYGVAARFTLLVLARNRLAVVFLTVLIPIGIALAHHVVSHDVLPFHQSSTGAVLSGGGEQITMISCALNASCQLIGFAMFSSAKHAGDFDLRLTAAGYPRSALVLAKLTSLVGFAALVAAYAAAWMRWFWPMEQPLSMWVAVFLAGLVYGAMGLFLALFLPGQLEGMFTIITITVTDLLLQNPLLNRSQGGGLMEALPAYGAMQIGIGAGFTQSVPSSAVLVSLLWTVVFAATAFVAFLRRTR
ncbi:hypothetical protein [Saccharothrix variisporea]|uniref:ABC-2 family transporter n=1 Tax=Saccharothrix variisporea TaxID=543527 RepID=A0A495X2W1_9PSEU|nr:hypothetical protein [Saccharothrix variisporea]RKT67585.1 hypothetical protein DFJ66_0761 [Saccharothrix variisporea]